MKFARMVMEAEAPNLVGYDTMRFNLSESSVRDRTLRELGIDLGDLPLPYGHHFGDPRLRAVVAEQSGAPVGPDDVLVTAGAAGALFLVASSLLEREDRVVVGFPNYATNFETPLAIGTDVVLHEQRFDDGFRLDLDRLAEQVTPGTRFVSLTVPHNPSGTMIDEADLHRLVALVEERDTYLLFDETYRDMTYGTPLPVAATLSERVISIGSMSKSWGVPGIRIGWLVSRDRALVEQLVAGKEQIGITGSVVDEEIALRILEQRDTLAPRIHAEVLAGLAVLERWVAAEDRVEWVRPAGGVAALVRVRGASDERMRTFYDLAVRRHGVYVAPGYWFKLPLDQLRIGFGWSAPELVAEGLAAVSAALDDAFGG